MSDKLLDVIEELQSDESLNSLLEADISRSVILRILDALNWSTSNRREVNPEYFLKGGRVDFALLTGNRPKVFIEVKRGGEPLAGHQEQLLGYAFRQGVKIALLTNGATWWFYLPLQEGSWEERRFATVEFDRQDKEEIVQKLETLLGKKNVISGKAVQNAEILYEQSQKKEEISATLPEAWHQLVSEPDDFLVDLLAEKTEELCGHKPVKNEVEQFLLAHIPIIDRSSNVFAPVRKVQVPLPSQPKGSAVHGHSEFWAPIREGDSLFAGKPVPIQNEGWIRKDIHNVEVCLYLTNQRCYIQLYFQSPEHRDKIMALFPKPDYEYEYRDSPKEIKAQFRVLDKGKNNREDWPEIREKLVSMGSDIYNKISKSST